MGDAGDEAHELALVVQCMPGSAEEARNLRARVAELEASSRTEASKA